MTLLSTAAIGLFAALLMFCGDMLLYFTTGPFEVDGTLKPYAGIMKDIPTWRLTVGGLLGPIAAFYYCIGFYHIALSAEEAYATLAFVATLLCSFGIIVGGAYHAQFTYFGLVGKSSNADALNRVTRNIQLLSYVSTVPIALGSLLLAGLILLGKTYYPPWAVVCTPVVTIFFSFAWRGLPQPFRVILFGGWNNLVYVIYFLTSLLLCAF